MVGVFFLVAALVSIRWVGGVWLFVECCIVDASIFVLGFVCGVKFLRAHGGCLGIRSR